MTQWLKYQIVNNDWLFVRDLLYKRCIPLFYFSNRFLRVWDGHPLFLVPWGFKQNVIPVGFLVPFLRICTNHLHFLLCISPMNRSIQ